MSAPWFNIPTRQKLLWSAAKMWEGTPFFAHSESCGFGVDCVRYIRALYYGVGAIGNDILLPAYSIDGGHHLDCSPLVAFIKQHPTLGPRFVDVALDAAPIPGDLLTVRSGRHPYHLAVRLPWDKVTHATQAKGVVIHDEIEPAFSKRVVGVLRLMEVEQ